MNRFRTLEPILIFIHIKMFIVMGWFVPWIPISRWGLQKELAARNLWTEHKQNFGKFIYLAEIRVDVWISLFCTYFDPKYRTGTNLNTIGIVDLDLVLDPQSQRQRWFKWSLEVILFHRKHTQNRLQSTQIMKLGPTETARLSVGPKWYFTSYNSIMLWVFETILRLLYKLVN